MSARVFPFATTVTNEVEFEKVFKYQKNSTDETYLKNATMVRNEVVNAFKMDVPAESKAMVLESYMPYLFSFVYLLEAHPKMKLRGSMKFTWTTVLHKKGKNPVEMNSIRFELVMCIVNLALQKSNHARKIMKTPGEIDTDEAYKVAASHLKEAAGILEYLFTMQLPHWTDLPKERPPEVVGGVSNGLSHLLCAEAQLIALKKLEDKKGSGVLIAKLAMGIVRMIDSTETAFKKLSKDYGNMVDLLKTFLKVERCLSYAKATRYMAQDAYKKEEYGKAVAFIRASVESIKKILGTKMCEEEIKAEKEIIKECKKQFEGDNDSIYYQQIPSSEELEALMPEAKVIMQPTKWMPPEPVFTKLEIIEE